MRIFSVAPWAAARSLLDASESSRRIDSPLAVTGDGKSCLISLIVHAPSFLSALKEPRIMLRSALGPERTSVYKATTFSLQSPLGPFFLEVQVAVSPLKSHFAPTSRFFWGKAL